MLLRNASVFYRGNFADLDIRLSGAYITEVGQGLSGIGRDGTPEASIIDLSGKCVLPGLIDLHTHGCMGMDFSKAGVQDMKTACTEYARHGVTGVLATTVSMMPSDIENALSRITEAVETGALDMTYRGSRILGINLEGPFFGPEKCGVHKPENLHAIDNSLFEHWDVISRRLIKIINVDPTLPDALRFIDRYGRNKRISLGHTNCTYAQAAAAVRSGAKQVTHCFNAMSPLNHREPGLVGAATDFGLTTELICDGYHIHQAIVRLMFAAVSTKIVLVSDSGEACGMPDGDYEICGIKVKLSGNKVVSAGDESKIAGSASFLYDCMRNCISWGVPKENAILSATLYPAMAIGADVFVGSIDVGKCADLLITDKDLLLEKVILNGEII